MPININKLNLDEQEQLAAVGHFWQKWGVLLLGIAVAALLAVGGWYGYGYYQAKQAIKANALYDQVLTHARAADTEKLAASLKALQADYASTVQTQQAEILAARVFHEQGQVEPSRAALLSAAARSADKGLQSTARLQLAALMIEQKQYDEAVKQLSSGIEPGFAALAADRMGDAYALQGKRAEAIDAYTQAFKTMDAARPYRQMLAAKLSGFGIDATTLIASAAVPASAAAPAASVAAPSASPATSTPQAAASAP